MKFNQLMKKIGYNTVVNVYRVTSIEHAETEQFLPFLSQPEHIDDLAECRKRSGQHLSMKSCQEQRILSEH